MGGACKARRVKLLLFIGTGITLAVDNGNNHDKRCGLLVDSIAAIKSGSLFNFGTA